jgi:hypothetical protein
MEQFLKSIASVFKRPSQPLIISHKKFLWIVAWNDTWKRSHFLSHSIYLVMFSCFFFSFHCFPTTSVAFYVIFLKSHQRQHKTFTSVCPIAKPDPCTAYAQNV